MNEILCKQCGKPIPSKNDLVVGSYFSITRPYHAACFAKKGKSSFFIKDWPVNSKLNTIGIFISAIILLSFFFLNDIYYLILGAIALITLTYSRISSYLRYEKKLPEGAPGPAVMHAKNPGACYYCGKTVGRAEATTARAWMLPKVYLLHEACFGNAVAKFTSPKLSAEPVNSKKFLLRYKQSPALFIFGIILIGFGAMAIAEQDWSVGLLALFGIFLFVVGVIVRRMKKKSDQLLAGCQ